MPGSPESSSRARPLTSWPSPATRCSTAAGYFIDYTGQRRSLVIRWYRGAWYEPNRPTGIGNSTLYGIAATAANIWAAGQIGSRNLAPRHCSAARRGPVAAVNTTSYGYDHANNPATLASTTLSYDAANQLTKSVTGTTTATLRTNLRFIGRRVVPQLYPADLPLPRERVRLPGCLMAAACAADLSPGRLRGAATESRPGRT